MSRILEVISQYFQLLVFILFFISLVFSFLNNRKSKKILMYFGNKQFDITSYFNMDATTQKQTFIYRIFNKNVHDLRLASFGYQYKGQAIDLIQMYRKHHNISESQQITVQPRDFMTFHFPIEELKKIILTINKGTLKVNKISTYVIDSMGMISVKPMPKMQYYLTQSLKDDVIARKKEIKAIKAQTKKERQLERYNLRLKQSQKRRDALQAFYLKIKGMFNKNKKK